MNNFKSEAGFSLIELSFSITIFTIASIIIISFFISNLGTTSQSLKSQALSLCSSTLEEYKAKKLNNLNNQFNDYGEITGYEYNTKKFKRKIEVGGKNLKKIKVTVFWHNESNQEEQISLSTLRSTESIGIKKKKIKLNQALQGLLLAKADLAKYKQKHTKFPAWDNRAGNLKKLATHYSKFNTKVNHANNFFYRNPRFYEWWKEGYLLVYRYPIANKYYCLSDKSGIFTITADEKTPQQILGDIFANTRRDKLIFSHNATKFIQGGDNNEQN